MSGAFQPLLASPYNPKHLDYDNLWGSPKLDGIRAFIEGGRALSRKLKLIPNKHVQEQIAAYEGYDGELIVGEPHAKDVYNKTYSGVMTAVGTPDFRFYVFDHTMAPEAEYHRRHSLLRDEGPVIVLPQVPITSPEELLRYEESQLELGYEGIMLRKFKGPLSTYKFGRSTAKEGTLLKVKRFVDAEVTVIGYVEEMRNDNEATIDERGLTKRSSHQENKVGKGRLGALICRTEAGIEFNVGSGFTAEQREKLWAVRDTLPGLLITYKSFMIGVKDAPRFPVFKGFRSPIDL
jgi:DNA ligase-1